MLIWILPFVALALHFAYARYRTSGVYGDWNFLLGPHARRRIEQLETEVELTGLTLQEAFAAAREQRSRAHAEAVRLLEMACGVACEATDDRLQRLATVSKCLRMLAAATPVPPLMPREFRLRQLASLAGLSTLLHHFLVTTPERLALRVSFLGWGFRLVRRVLTRSTAAVAQDAEAATPWVRFEEGTEDFQVLDAEHVEAVRTLLTSLAAFPRTEPGTVQAIPPDLGG